MLRLAIGWNLPAAVLISLGLGAPAQALNDKSWLKSNGSDAAACTVAAPCATLQRGHDQTNPGGEVGFLDSGTYQVNDPLIINKAISFLAEGVDATILHSGMGNVAIYVAPATSTDVVRLQGLNLDGLGAGAVGIYWTGGGAALEIKNCVVKNFRSSSSNQGFGILTNGNAQSKFVVTDTVVANNGNGINGTTGAGIAIKPSSGGSAQVLLERITAVNNVFGIAVDGSGSTAGVNMTLADSVAHGNSQDGIVAVTIPGKAPVGVYVKNTKSSNNAIGIRSIGPNVTVRVDGSSVIGNNTGLSFSGGGTLLSLATMPCRPMAATARSPDRSGCSNCPVEQAEPG